MKNKISLVYLVGFLLIVISCEDFMDKDIDTTISESDVFSDSYYARGFLNSCYEYLQDGYSRIDGAMFACASDEAKHSYSSSYVNVFNNGSLSPSFNPDDVWTSMYSGVRATNLFLLKLKTTIQESGLITETNRDSGLVTRSNIAEWNRMKGEAFLLRAWYHYELVKRYKNIPYIDTVLTLETTEKLEQLPFDSVVNRIVADCDTAVKYLPLIYDRDKQKDLFGRASGIAALALKSRIFLLAASPLNNPGNDLSLWKKAADAAIAVMNHESSDLKLLTDYSQVFSTPYNAEVIFATQPLNRNDIEQNNYPISYQGNGYTNPTQDLADAYEMKNTGLPITSKLSGYDPNNPYEGRDDRFEKTIGYNGLIFKSAAIETLVGGKDGLQRTPTATKTGYYLMKFVDSGIDLSDGTQSRRQWIFIRYAEILLNYAEAMNEYLEHPDNTVFAAIDKVRKRAGLPKLSITLPGLTKDEMRIKIRNERRVELAFEDFRFWDVRRWLEGGKYLNKPVHGMKITEDSTGTLTYTIFEVEQRVFRDAFNWYPIPDGEIVKTNNLKQNEGW